MDNPDVRWQKLDSPTDTTKALFKVQQEVYQGPPSRWAPMDDKWRRLKVIIFEAMRNEMVRSIEGLPISQEKTEIHRAKYDALKALMIAMLEMEEEA